MNIYAGVSDDLGEIVKEAATKSLENEIRAAIDHLHQGQNGRFEAVLRILSSFVGDGWEYS